MSENFNPCEECPVYLGHEDECPIIERDRLLANKSEWYQPTVQALIVEGYKTGMELHYNIEGFTKENYADQIQAIRERYKLDNYLVYTKCPKCGVEVPAIDMRTDNVCVFCYCKQKEEDEGVTILVE